MDLQLLRAAEAPPNAARLLRRRSLAKRCQISSLRDEYVDDLAYRSIHRSDLLAVPRGSGLRANAT